MIRSTTPTATGTSTDRTPALVPTPKPKTVVTRVGGATRRLLSALMRSLAAPHV
jgi:hypothetical protein